MSKADYVRFAAARHAPSGRHTCHWPGCERKVPPAMWGCKSHWFKLPAVLRAKVWRTYEPGQEISKTPSADYLAVAREVQDWIAAQVGRNPEGGDATRLRAEHEHAVGSLSADAPNSSGNPSQGEDHHARDFKLTLDEVRHLLRERAAPFARRRGSTGVSAWAQAHSVNDGNLSLFMNGKQGPPTDVLRALGLEWAIVASQDAPSGDAWEGPPYEYGVTWGPVAAPSVEPGESEVERVARAMKPGLFSGGPDSERGPATVYEREVARNMARAAIAALARPDRDAIEAETVDLLAELGKHTNWELSHGGWEDYEQLWKVHSVNGGRNDREWTLIGEGNTPQEALTRALERGDWRNLTPGETR